ncbi:MAG: ATP-grasp domain-containing protein [Lachnospiraceae bacterium]|nr:ATP-grasp domain-containing protein [Lachnospiraceae bacterium]MDE6184253.1 ATP-grasp domain-containing protein [Lachnospiraceae bacterium]MDE7287408.1 ATP-grasp domain-containing protein [Lachnospiraceae bacterium]
MKAAIIGASGEAVHTIQKVHEYGLDVVALDGNPKAEGLKYADIPLITDISDEESTIQALRQEKPDFILTVPIGRYLTTIGAANDALKLPGISKKAAVLCTDKWKFHQRLSSQGLRNCQCYPVDGGRADLSQIHISFPAILKPRYGSGSRGLFMLACMEDLEKALAETEGEPYVLEECAQGEEYGVDGAVTKDGFWMILLRRKENTPPPARQAVGYYSVPPTDAFWQQVQKYMKNVIECLELNECLLHADLIRGEKDPFAIEISARPSGHNLHNLFTPLCTGVDMAEEYIRYRLGRPYSFVPEQTKSMMIHYFDMQGKVTAVPDVKQVENVLDAHLAAWNCQIKEGEDLAPVSDGHSVMGRGYFVLEGKDAAFLHNQAEMLKGLFFM